MVVRLLHSGLSQKSPPLSLHYILVSKYGVGLSFNFHLNIFFVFYYLTIESLIKKVIRM